MSRPAAFRVFFEDVRVNWWHCTCVYIKPLNKVEERKKLTTPLIDELLGYLQGSAIYPFVFVDVGAINEGM